jgi:hypothetical protein
MKDRIETKNMYVDRSQMRDNKYYWAVYSDTNHVLITGYTDTFEYAVYAAHNYIKNHQNEVFDATEFYTEESA